MNAKRGNCYGLNDDTLFPDEEDPAAVADALEVCYGCPVRVMCLVAALSRGELYGIWGGTSPEDRRSLLGTLAEVAA